MMGTKVQLEAADRQESAAANAAKDLLKAANTESAVIYRPHPDGGFAIWVAQRDARTPATQPETPRIWWDRPRGWQLRDNGYYFISPLGERGEFGLAVLGPWLNPRLGPRRALLISAAADRATDQIQEAVVADRAEATAGARALSGVVGSLIPHTDEGLAELLLQAIKNEVEADEVRHDGSELVIIGARRRSDAPVKILADALTRLEIGGDVQLTALEALADAVDARAAHTMGHSDRIRSWSVGIAVEMQLPPETVRSIEIAGKLHDLATGFTGREALYKAKLDEDERSIIRRHSELGSEILRGAGYPEGVYLAVRGHHERWDGAGYPDGLEGEEIPIGARIVALPEVFDAFTSARPWREPLPMTKAVETLLEAAGSQFDPDVVSAFLAAWWNSTPKPQRRFVTYQN